jgi:hypothetical protein
LFSLLSVDEIAQSTAQAEGLKIAAREAYLRYEHEWLLMKVGQQILVRGVSDAISPNDVLSARDFTMFTTDEEFRRQGLLAALISYTPKQGASALSFTLTWAPLARENTLLLPATLTPTGVTLRELERPNFALKNSETSLRAEFVGDGFDLAIGAYWGWNRTPYYQVISRDSLTSYTLGPKLERMKLLGIEGSTSFQKWVLRAESAVRVVERSFNSVDTVLGAERPLGARFRLQVQTGFRVLTDFYTLSSVLGSDVIDTGVRQGVERLNRILQNQKRETAINFTTRLSQSSDSGDWESELFVMLNANGGDYLIRPLNTLLLTEGLKWSLGAEIFGGSLQEPLGAIGPYRSIFTEMKYFF